MLSTFGTPVWAWIFDSASSFVGNNAPGVGRLRASPRKIVPGETLVIIPPVESIEVWTPCEAQQYVQQQQGGRAPDRAWQTLLAKPFDNGLFVALSNSDDAYGGPNADVGFFSARVRNVDF